VYCEKHCIGGGLHILTAVSRATKIIIITDLYSTFRSEDMEVLDAAQED